ncbi:hypothetical protein FRT60_21760 [Pseudomonas haemolytica]|uniref:Uncharacterized protein n=1 Tax=Pseudomonas haemolytica TaxID=2600065 RepID=A0A646P6W3_9PSED|nr:hypothetical protein [Pseudomonas haemolytica]
MIAASASPCGSGLAREDGVSANINVCWTDVFASKSNRRTAAPTFDLRCLEHFVHLTDPPPPKSRSAASGSKLPRPRFGATPIQEDTCYPAAPTHMDAC